MGDGRFVSGKLTFLVSMAYVMTAADRTAWRAALQRSSDFMHVATGGQVQFGEIYLVDDSFGRLSADVWVFNTTGTAEATQGEYGTPGAAVHYYDNDRGSPSIFDHELAHHVWNVGDEYAGPMQPLTIDRSTPADELTIPVVEALVAGALIGASANVRKSQTQSDRRKIESNTEHRIVVETAFPAPPTSSPANLAYVQDTNVACGSPGITGVDFCVMESPATGVVSFCDPTTHNAVELTDQQVRNGTSCWETILATPGFEALTLAPGSPATSPDPVTFVEVLKEARFVLAIDRSGSMIGDKLAYAKEGARYWIDSCALADDHLSVIAYNSTNTISLPLTQVSTIPDRTTITAAIDGLTATGQTNVRDALREGVTQITSRPGRVVTQAVVVLTDGKHNRPPGSRLIEAAPELVDNHVMAATIAIGEGADVDAAELDELAYQTGGHFALIGLSNPIDIETTLIETDMYLRGGLVDTQSFDFIPAPVDRAADAAVARLYKRRRQPRLDDVLEVYHLHSSGLSGRRPFDEHAARFRLAKIYVEEGCDRISCAINHPLGAAFDVFLVDPAGAAVTVDDATVRRAAGPAHTLLTVAGPAHGVWRVIVFAREVPTATSVHLSVGAENRRLVVTGGCSRSVYRTNERPRLYARAAWDHELTGLRVDARIVSPNGTDITVPLSDGDVLTDAAGRYTADVSPLRVGHYHGVIRISVVGRPLRAGLLHIANHTTATRLSASSTAPRFERRIPFRFHVTKGR